MNDKVTTARKAAAMAVAALVGCAQAAAQRHEILDDGIATLQVVAGQDWTSPPVIRLGGEADGKGTLHVGFDDLTHAYRRFTYRIEHCEADWSVSEGLFPSDYVEGFASGNTIDDYEESINTNVLYTHYSLDIPNDLCRLRMSGNYRLTVMDDDDGERPVLVACFMVTEQGMDVSLDVTSNTDIDVNGAHQQVSMRVGYGSCLVTDHEAQVKTVVMQNGRWDNARVNAKPQYVMSDGLGWEHCRDFIFPAGNEYHKYEVLDVTHASMGVDRIAWDGESYHVFPNECVPRPNYLHDEDANGAFYIRNSDNVENDVASEYVYVHYVLNCPERVDGDVYLNGAWTYDRFTPEYRMEYDPAGRRYEATVMQKQGYYSYQFLLVDAGGRTRTMPTEGDYCQTENKYQALVYFRGRGERADRLMGYCEVSTR